MLFFDDEQLLVSLKNVISEAEDDKSPESYQTDKADTDTSQPESGIQGGEEPTEDDTTEEPATDEEPVDEEGTDEEPTDEGEDTGDGTEEGQIGDEPVDDGQGNEKLKKLVLLGQFKEMDNIIRTLDATIDNLYERGKIEKSDAFSYLKSKINELREKFDFNVSNNFINGNYKSLLKLFYFFKYNLNDLTNLTEKLVSESQNTKQ